MAIEGCGRCDMMQAPIVKLRTALHRVAWVGPKEGYQTCVACGLGRKGEGHGEGCVYLDAMKASVQFVGIYDSADEGRPVEPIASVTNAGSELACLIVNGKSFTLRTETAYLAAEGINAVCDAICSEIRDALRGQNT